MISCGVKQHVWTLQAGWAWLGSAGLGRRAGWRCGRQPRDISWGVDKPAGNLPRKVDPSGNRMIFPAESNNTSGKLRAGWSGPCSIGLGRRADWRCGRQPRDISWGVDKPAGNRPKKLTSQETTAETTPEKLRGQETMS